MNSGNAIEVSDLKKKFKVYFDKGSSLKEKILFKNRNRYEERWVLNGISFNVKKGEAIGLIGHNGCGKSTILKLLSKIIYPDSGNVKMEGRVSSLIELGAGFHPDMSGKENIYTNAAIFGLKKSEIGERLDTIIEFSELEEYIDNPVRTYSSGMYMRLAFSVAINVDADIILIDEILAVGDAHFQEKCFNKLKQIKRNGATIVIVSHSLGQIEEICEKTIWIDKGLIELEGIPFEVHSKYLDFMNVEKKVDTREEKRIARAKANEDEKYKYQNGNAKINRITMWNEKGDSHEVFHSGKSSRMEIEYEIENYNDKAVIGVDFKKDHWLRCYGTDLKSFPPTDFSIDIKEADYLFYLSKINSEVNNLIDNMYINSNCEKTADGILMKTGGVVWGPYIKVGPLSYKLEVDVEIKEGINITMTVTADSGKKQLDSFLIKTGKNKFNLSLEDVIENLEFVIQNNEEDEILIKQIFLT